MSQATPLAPPEERFWKRYSPHHEFPLSSLTSFALHALAVAVVFFVGFLAARLGFGDTKPLPMDMIEVAGGGGNPQGVGNAPGDLPPVSGQEEKTTQPDTTPKPTPPADDVKLEKPVENPPDLPDVKQEPNTRVIDEADKATKEAAQVVQGFKDMLKNPPPVNRQGPGYGKGGPGSGGGEGKGRGSGKGDNSGPGETRGNLTKHQKRAGRWELRFDSISPEEYVKQMAGLGAILVFPAGDHQFRVYRNLLGRPAQGSIEDISQLIETRVYWADENPSSVMSVGRVLGVSPPPRIMGAFIPPELEEDLLRKEQAFRGKSEDELKETKFQVYSVGGGKYDVRVTSQK